MPYLSRGWLGSQECGTGPCWVRSVKGKGLAIIHALSHPECIPGAPCTGSFNSSSFLCVWLSWMLLPPVSSASLCFVLPKGLRDSRSITSRSSCPDLTCPTQQRIKNSHRCQIRIQRVLWVWGFINTFRQFLYQKQQLLSSFYWFPVCQSAFSNL